MAKLQAIMKNEFVVMSFRLIVGIFFIYASLHKIVEPLEFAKDIQNYKLIPYAYTNLIALVLPWIEFLAGLFLVLNYMPKGAVILINGMLLVFIVALSSAIFRGLNIHCGCTSAGGSNPGSSTELWISIIRNIIFLGMMIPVLKYSKPESL